jgi:hypothetical protein
VTAVDNNNTNTVTIEFSEPVMVAKKDVLVSDGQGELPDIAAAGFSHTPGGSTVLIDFSGILGPGRYSLMLNGSTVHDLAGNLLDGNADGIPGGDFEKSFTIRENEPPVIASLTANPDQITRPGSLTVTAIGVYDPDGTVARVEFYQGELLLGVDEDGTDGWNWTADTGGWTLGSHTLFAVALDHDGAWSPKVSASVRRSLFVPPTAQAMVMIGWYRRERPRRLSSAICRPKMGGIRPL